MHYQGDKRRAFVKGEGCPACFDTGFHGRLGIYEVLEVDQRMRELICREQNLETLRKAFRESGGRSLLEEGLRLAEKEQTSLDEVMRVAYFE